MTTGNNSTFLNYQQFFKNQNPSKQKSMNVQSPVFVPNSSFSSSTGGEVSINSNTNSNGNILASSLELTTPLAGINGWPALNQGTNEFESTLNQGSSGKKHSLNQQHSSFLKAAGAKPSDIKKA